MLAQAVNVAHLQKKNKILVVYSSMLDILLS